MPIKQNQTQQLRQNQLSFRTNFQNEIILDISLFKIRHYSHVNGIPIA